MPFVTAGEANEGISTFIGNSVHIFKKGTITIDMFGSAKYRNYEYGADDHVAVINTEDISHNCAKFITSAIHKATYTGAFNYSKNFYPKDANETTILLPSINGKPDYAFMDKFISLLEADRIRELEAYLTATGLKNTTLSKKEEKVLEIFEHSEDKQTSVQIWKEFKIGELFDKINTRKLPYRAKELPKIPDEKNSLPALTSSFINQGLNYYVPKEGADVLKNVISLPSNSDVYRAYFQSLEFTVLSDSYAIKWKSDKEKISVNQYLFFVQCINKVTDLPIYSYKNKLGGWNVVKDKKIFLPTKDGEIDFLFMETLINAVKKIAIKDVVEYTDLKIEATKSVVNR